MSKQPEALRMERSIEQWRGCIPRAMAMEQSETARAFAFAAAKHDILLLHALNAELVEALRIHHEWSIAHMDGYSESGDERVAYRATAAALAKATP
jgi:hypothetical protein